MLNQAMQRKIDNEGAIDLCQNARNDDGDYILTGFRQGVEYCDSSCEAWIWSIGQHKETGAILASTSTKFYTNSQYECLFLR